jgi:integrase
MVYLWFVIMPKQALKLLPKQVQALVDRKPTGFYPVGGVVGLYIKVVDNNGRRSASWVLRIVINGKRHNIGLGGYKTLSLSKARSTADKLRVDIKYYGHDPFKAKQEAAQEASEREAAQAKLKTFKQVAEAFISKKSLEYKTLKQTQKLTNILETYAYPFIGDMLVKDIELIHIHDMLSGIWLSKHETANRTRMYVSGVFDMAIAEGVYTSLNPARWKGGLAHFLVKPDKAHKVQNRESLHVDDMPKLWKKLITDTSRASKLLQFIILTGARHKEASLVRWSDVDMVNKVWTKPGTDTKGGEEHRVPLTSQCLQLIKSMPNEGDYIFPNSEGKPLSDAAVTKAHRKYKLVGTTGRKPTTHGFRSTFKDWARTMTNYPDELSEIQISHKTGDSTHQAYARDDLLEKRRRLVQDWANYCEHGKAVTGENVRAIRA